MDSMMSCPFCHLSFPQPELQWHANSHFNYEDEQFVSDLELAQQIALAPCSPTQTNDESEPTFQSHTSLAMAVDEKISCLISLQIKSPFYHIKEGLMSMLHTCLASEPDNSTITLLCGYVDHFQSVFSEDVGWGCGWRNIQMLSSHLLYQRQDARQVLFGGSGFIPDIPSLQRWLEIAWDRGFDVDGSHHFNHQIYGSKSWIGATECAALLRSFGLRARIVDFGPKELEPHFLSVPGSSLGPQMTITNARAKRKLLQVYGPMDRFLLRKHDDDPKLDHLWQHESRLSSKQLCDSTNNGCGPTLKNNISRKTKGGHQNLIEWVWNYFSDKIVTSGAQHRVVVTDKAPLYFQHEGHSRTIVGIQVRNQQNGMEQYNLLILDPAHRTEALERSLKDNIGWQKLIKRGVHTLKKLQYQLCYIDPGIAGEEDMEQLKTINSIFIEI
ncbi:zinc finger-containing ubiquitin peptidase 1-like [Tripterygium wilfordii]|uniref:zinc finger-containing ubiquitin peptidase 1-like n=1 Tax=Tripterygium wilfordii TaxID=458696 RepID=UPI0018F7FBEB|nr:zinc finger-containing ubiquitin peptidase 1-like [Tripterygium wilfordii]XP_038685492.1 zinc finger-containing ubiquitin peptidase 1-like [Tripterygium wilfordii]XP_038697209.1 zinc finger-containing ubiquitin peptidase 1-like [Tripterygium wilfordii]